MVISSFEWAIIGAAASMVIGVIGFFLKSLFKKPEKHEGDISHIRENFAKKETVEMLGQKLSQMQQEFPQKFATKDDLKEMRLEMRQDNHKLTRDIEEIKDNYLTKADFLSNSRKTEDRVEKIYDILVKGGPHNG